MKTTELFDFRFVDREHERDIFNNFFLNINGSSLWIQGNRGFGKTAFFHDAFKTWSEYALCYIDIKIDSNSKTIISDFILELQKYCSTDFLSMVKKNYKQFYNGIYKKTKNITSEIFPDISSIVSSILDFSYCVITYAEERKSSLEIISDYIKMILNSKKLCICVDNFSRCDEETAQIFFSIFKSFFNENYFKSCIITTKEDLTDSLQEKIFRNLPYTNIKIEKFNKYSYFCQILRPIFSMQNFSSDDIEYLYRKCNGSPKKLSTVISKLLEKGAINIKPIKAEINKEALYSILQADHIRFKDDDFNSKQKWILFSYLCLSEYAPVEQLLGLALYVSKKNFLFGAYNEDVFREELANLVNNKILNYDINNKVSVCHDNDYYELLDIFKESYLKGIFCKCTYEFLLTYPDFPSKQELLCYNAREAEITNWTKMNFLYGKKLVRNKQYYDAHKIFMKMEKHIYELHALQILRIALTSYMTGNFQLAIKQLQLISVKELRFHDAKYHYYFCLGKSFYNIGQMEKAISNLELALNEVAVDSEKYAQTINVLHMYYFEIPEKEKESYEIFNKIKISYRYKFPTIWANTMRGCHNFLGNIEALKVLDEAHSLLDDEVDQAFVITTRGFVYIKLNQTEKAKQQFETAYEIIKRLKIHECSYAANNLALCYMLKRDYQKANEILLEALLWNRTNYGNIVLQTHLMICSLYLSSKEISEDYFNYLEKYMEINKPTDPILNRKVYMNLAIASMKLGNSIVSKAYLAKAKDFIENTSSEWRYYSLTGENEKYKCMFPSAEYQLIEDFDPWFLVYAHD